MDLRVYLNDGKERKKVEAELVKRNRKSFWVRLPGGDIVKRKIERDLVK